MALAEAGRLPTGLHPSAGQEAVGVGACFGLRDTDWVLPALRTTEAYWTRGVTLLQMMNAIMANSGSISMGKESFHHCGYPALGIIATPSIVAAQIPMAVGAAQGLRMKGTDDVTVCFFGDGATSRGDFHEGLNLAALLRTPVVFVCENNLYFQTVPASVGLPIEDVADRAASYGMPGVIVDGQDVLAVHEATAEAVRRARGGEGPSLVECKTYRFFRHHSTLRETRPLDEVARWQKRDPLTILADTLQGRGLLDDTTIEEMDGRIGREMDDAVKESMATPGPDAREAFTHVYAEPIETMKI
jgi:pyruvate dehydrogenase E1 component alpha subunit